MDIAADRGDFIANVTAAEKWACDVRDTSANLPRDVRFIQCDGLSLDLKVPNGHFDVVFMSNYLEHLASPDAVVEQLRVARRLLKTSGRLIILQPNIRHVGPAYWDFIDHRVALTERSLVEAATIAGFRTRTLASRFLPYSVKGRLPTHALLVRAYLAFPPAWRILGKQTLYIGEPAA
jgi:SAM-dependent methyltransferase